MDRLQHLKKIFGFEDFRPPQDEVVDRALEGKSSLLVMPTGGGKSLCFQYPASIDGKFVLVISPLIALMKDQVDKARKIGLDATFINSSLNGEEKSKRLRQLTEGKYQLLYVTPERFRKPDFVEGIMKRGIDLLAVDEAHCISQWGQDFRPEYSRVGEIRKELGSPTFLAATATATEKVQQDILSILSGDGEDVESFVTSVNRPNLSLRVHDLYGEDSKVRSIFALRHQVQGPIIVYSSLISTLHRIGDELSKLGLEFLVYHGQMKPGHRRTSQEQFLNSDSAMILATPAFGLGVDKPNVRAVIHAELPRSIEDYFQEIGRGGRDGLPAEAHLLLDEDDVATQMDFIKWSTPEPSFVEGVYNLIRTNKDKVAAGGRDYIREQMNFYNKRDFRVETAVNLLERWECIRVDERRSNIMEAIADLPPELVDNEGGETRRNSLNSKLLQMLHWAQDTDLCRMQSVRKYFGELDAEECGICDVCAK